MYLKGRLSEDRNGVVFIFLYYQNLLLSSCCILRVDTVNWSPFLMSYDDIYFAEAEIRAVDAA